MIAPPPAPSWRKPAGAFLILLLIALWLGLVVQVAGPVARLHWAAQALFYAAAGLAWIWLLPLRRLLRWMETGRWR
ncbi:DUF2842 domain-containing protein [Sphingomonas morindae]|uniref:DUF2842 domain-containing protein n=1 Tax=Sphingomonas morindae TaxID=1541170 RepID=A0ABY4XAI9_9SPHN|nr:DUF2842 domain-containing protein [Sphingomonas morindae]USI73700.1 DUF2842 domain-containing protein [Sphingomonas morindae]